MRSILVVIFIASYQFLNAQLPMIDAGPSDTTTCPPECIDLVAVYEGGGGNTSDYDISVIPFAPDAYAGTLVPLSDDDVSPLIPIGFDFCFYGNSYSEVNIGSNGWIGFSGGPFTFTSEPVPSVSPGVPKNCIMGPWYDINPGVGGTVRYQTLGVAPLRRFVVSYTNVPHFLCGGDLETYQIILYETSNEIENHIQTKGICFGWDDGNAVQALHNIDGTAAIISPGRNNTPWSATNDAIRYTPMGDPDIEWYDATGTLIGTGAAITICPIDPMIYTVNLISCGTIIATDDIFIDIVCCAPPTIVPTNVSCFGACDGSATATGVGTAPFSYLWDAAAGSQTTATATGLCAGTYSVTTTDAAGCVETSMITITEPTELSVATVLTNVSCAGAADGAAVATASGGVPPYSYDFGAGPSASGTFSGITIGAYTLTVTDANGCVVVFNFTITDTPIPVVSFISDLTEGCAPLLVTFDNTGESGVSCEWNFGDGSISSSCGTVIHEYEFDGDYTVSLKVTNVDGCFTTLSYTNYITVHPNPVASFIYSPYNPSTINSEVRFTDYSTDADLWEWSFGAIGNSNVENPTFLFPEIAGEYPVELIVTTNQGCADTLVKIVTVYQEHLIFVPNVITPDGDQFNEVFTPYFTGIDIYDYHLTVYNRWGEILFESYNLATGWNGTYGGEIVPDGVYIWTIETADVATDKRFEFNGHVTVIK